VLCHWTTHNPPLLSSWLVLEVGFWVDLTSAFTVLKHYWAGFIFRTSLDLLMVSRQVCWISVESKLWGARPLSP
jgi:hypothetical protein